MYKSVDRQDMMPNKDSLVVKVLDSQPRGSGFEKDA